MSRSLNARHIGVLRNASEDLPGGLGDARQRDTRCTAWKHAPPRGTSEAVRPAVVPGMHLAFHPADSTSVALSGFSDSSASRYCLAMSRASSGLVGAGRDFTPGGAGILLRGTSWLWHRSPYVRCKGWLGTANGLLSTIRRWCTSRFSRSQPAQLVTSTNWRSADLEIPYLASHSRNRSLLAWLGFSEVAASRSLLKMSTASAGVSSEDWRFSPASLGLTGVASTVGCRWTLPLATSSGVGIEPAARCRFLPLADLGAE